MTTTGAVVWVADRVADLHAIAGAAAETCVEWEYLNEGAPDWRRYSEVPRPKDLAIEGVQWRHRPVLTWTLPDGSTLVHIGPWTANR